MYRSDGYILHTLRNICLKMAVVDLSKRFIVVCLLLISQVNHNEAIVGTVITVAMTAFDVASFARSVTEFIDSRTTGDTLSNGQLLAEFNARLGAAKTDVIYSIIKTSREEIIDGAVIAVHSSMVDLRKIVNAVDQDVAQAYERDYVKFYEQHKVVMHVRFLTELLTYKIPGQQFELLTHLAENNRCNLTALAEFADFYLHLVSNGIALQGLYDKFTKNISLNRVIEDEWRYGLTKIQNDLTRVEQKCIRQFSELAKSDLFSATSTKAFGQSNLKRYIYNWIDVMFYAPIRTYQFHYSKHVGESFFFQNTVSQNKIAVFGSRDDGDIWNARTIAQTLAKSELKVPAKNNENAARNVGEDVEAILKTMGYSFRAIVVYFDGDEFPEKGTFRDEDSPVASYVMDGVVLEYCHDSGFECYLNDIPLVGGGRETTAGKFKIYVYPQKDSSGYVYPQKDSSGYHYHHIINGAGPLSSPVFCGFVAFFIVMHVIM